MAAVLTGQGIRVGDVLAQGTPQNYEAGLLDARGLRF